MDLSVDEFVEGLLSDEAHNRSSDNGKIEELELKMQLPEWFDEKMYNQGRQFIWKFIFGFSMNVIVALLLVFAVPSILKILVGTRRSNSPYTAYKRYVSTLMHVFSWLDSDLKPGTTTWRSLLTVRTRHRRAGMEAQLKGRGTVSQRDVALTLCTVLVYVLLKPHKFGMRQLKEGDWESFNHYWRTIGYMLGLEDRYNVCRKNVDETREVCRILLERVYTPCLENVPEYFEYTARVTFGSLGIMSQHIEPNSLLFMTRYYADVPGYVYTDTERIAFQNKLKQHLKGSSEDIGVDSAEFISKSAVEGLPAHRPRLLYVRDFQSIETTPAYKRLNFAGRYRIAVINVLMAISNNSNIGRFIVNMMFLSSVVIAMYFPYKAFVKFGFRKSFVNMFVEDPKDNTEPKPNSEYEKPPPPDSWYGKLITVLW